VLAARRARGGTITSLSGCPGQRAHARGRAGRAGGGDLEGARRRWRGRGARSAPCSRPGARPRRSCWTSPRRCSAIAAAAALVVDLLLAAGSGGDLDAPGTTSLRQELALRTARCRELLLRRRAARRRRLASRAGRSPSMASRLPGESRESYTNTGSSNGCQIAP
jgi:hypothetical protein